jgi:hypothetical protein
MNKRRFYVLLNAEGEGSTGGAADGGSAAGGEGSAGASAGGADPAASGSGTAAAAGTALAAGGASAGGQQGDSAAGGAGAAASASAAEPSIPEKFIVKTAAGEIDHAATALKIAQAYGPLEKRMGGGDAPPQSAEGYKVNVPEALAEKISADDLAKSEDFKGFLGKMHELGLSQKQLDGVAAELLERSMKLQEAAPAMAAADCEAQLRQVEGWASDTEYRQQIRSAFTAGKQIFGADFDSLVNDYGNDPRFVRGLASIGKEMAEDMQPSPEAMAQIQENLDGLMSSPAYMDANHPQHSTTVAKVSALTTKMVGNKPVGSGKTLSFHS